MGSRRKQICFTFLLSHILLRSRSWAGPSSCEAGSNGECKFTGSNAQEETPPNIVLFVVDDLGWNQVGYHAKPVGNFEIQTPHIDKHAKNGVELDRGYMTPWCGPSRAAILTGRTNVYNANISNVISAFDDDIGFIAGLPAGTKTLATALKEFGESVGKPYTAHFNGKWGVGGTAWANTPMGMGFDDMRGFWGTGLETCDGVIPAICAIETYVALPFDRGFGPVLTNSLPGYFEQSPKLADTEWCDYIRGLPTETLSEEEQLVACKTHPRKLSKLLDLDLLDNVIDQIQSHDYARGPMFQYFSTAMLHQPVAYPKEYDVNSTDMPSYFQPGKTKPTASNSDLRLSIRNAVRYMDDLFGSTMQALKDAGQWNNTIVYFTTDNGGPVYFGNGKRCGEQYIHFETSHDCLRHIFAIEANNNYPLRASKFSPFEGGTRVVQFLSGGWIDSRLPSDSASISNTFIFPQDIAPTLLEMVGASRTFLLENNVGAVYGNQLWEYVKRSVKSKSAVGSQKVRKVSFSKDLFFDVQAERTLKKFFTGDTPMNIPRLWAPVWPKNDDLITDPNYKSVRPCRSNGMALDCCVLDVTNDFQERNPLLDDCEQIELEGKILFEIEGGCSSTALDHLSNPLCLKPGELNEGALVSKFSLWSHMGSAGPFTNSEGKAIDDLPMKCVCGSNHNSVGVGSPSFFNVKVFTPTECLKDERFRTRSMQSVSCDTASAHSKTTTSISLYDDFENEGIDKRPLLLLNRLEKNQLIFLGLPYLYQIFHQFLTREGYTEWPNLMKWPHVTKSHDSCVEKNATPLAIPDSTFPPYSFGGDSRGTVPVPSNFLMLAKKHTIGLCALFADNKFFCPSRQNRDLQYVANWSYERFDPKGQFADGKTWQPMSLLRCFFECKSKSEGTLYIGDGPYGLVY